MKRESALYSNYLRQTGGCVQLYPASALSLEAAIAQRERKPPALLSTHDVEELISWNSVVGNDEPRVIENINALLDPKTLGVATGQQAGLFLGPLYTTYKTLTAILLSERIAQGNDVAPSTRQRRVVPIFWIASEDSDFEEVRYVDLVNQRGELRRLSYTPNHYEPGMPVFNIGVEPSLHDLLDCVSQDTVSTEFRQGIIDMINEAINSSRDLEELFARLAAKVFKGTGLILISPRLGFVRRMAASVFEHEIRSAGISSRLVHTAASAVSAQGYKPTLQRRQDDVNFFLLLDRVRCKVRFRAGTFTVSHPATGKIVEQLSQAEMISLLKEAPERFCSNVVTRPLIQDAIFPTVAYVAGPGEIAYYAQLGGVYDFFGVAMPRIYPRPRVVLVEPRVEHALERLGCSVGDVVGRMPKSLIASAGLTGKATQQQRRIEKSIARITAELERLDRALSGSEPQLRAALDKTKSVILAALEKLKERTLAAATQADANRARQAAKVINSVRPYDKDQERVFNLFVPFLFNYGVGFVDFLRDRISLDNPDIQTIYLSQIKGYRS